MKSVIVAILLGVHLISLVTGDYDVTTVYKYNTVYAELNGEIVTKYLNTCDVSVHPPTNAIGLPYIMITNKSRSYQMDKPFIYPLESPTIPTLWSPTKPMIQNPFDHFQWKNLTSNGTMHSIDAWVYSVFPGWLNRNTLNDIKYKPTYIREEDGGSSTVFSKSSMNEINGRYAVSLLVEVAKNYSRDFSFRLMKLDGSHVTVIVYKNNSTMKICFSGVVECETIIYQSDEQYMIAMFVRLIDYPEFHDIISGEYYYTHNSRNESSDYYYNCYSTKRVNCYSYITRGHEGMYEGPEYGRPAINYKVVQTKRAAVAPGTTIVSPWLDIKNDSSFFVVYYRTNTDRIVVFLKDQKTQESIMLDVHEQTTIRIANTSDSQHDEVLSKINIRFPQNWTEKKQIYIKSDNSTFITNIWEGGDLDTYQIHKSTICVKENITDIFDIALKGPISNNDVTFCMNGGRLEDFENTRACACPPGFTGDYCEIACGRNYFGQKCSKFCSSFFTDNECKGMVLCTPSYGCSCAAGYHGNQCLQGCEEGTYGADCEQTCGQCKSGCDEYTGDCRGECDSPYLVWPLCKHPYSYWKGTPVILDSNFSSVKLSLDFRVENIVKFFNEPTFYLVQYKEDKETSWISCSHESLTAGVTDYLVDHLKPGRKYFFRVLLIDKNSLKTNDPQLSKISEGTTKCITAESHTEMTATIFTNFIGLTWNEETMEAESACPCLDCLGYTLDIHGSSGSLTEARTIFGISGKSIVLKFLAPGKTYQFNLKKLTVKGESHVISNITVSTPLKINTSTGKDIAVLITKNTGSKI